jgi:hypothetical protein
MSPHYQLVMVMDHIHIMKDDLNLCGTQKEAHKRCSFLNQLNEIERKCRDVIR